MTIDYTRPVEPPPRRSWWGRNWKWVVPVGCLTPLLLLGGCVAALVLVVFGAVRGTDLYENAVVRAKSDPRVIETLGAPVEARWWLSGSVQAGGDTGTADFSVPLRGSRMDGSLSVKASQDRGEWNYSVLRVRAEDGTVIDLIPPLDPSLEESPDTTAPDV